MTGSSRGRAACAPVTFLVPPNPGCERPVELDAGSRRVQRRFQACQRFVFPISALVALAVGCSSGDGPQQWQDAGAYRWIPLHVRGRQQGGFTQLSSWRTGLEFANGLSQEMLLGNRHLAHGSGVALGDADGDGLLDVYLARTDGPNALYRNRGNWRFEEIAEQVGVAAPNRFSKIGRAHV